MGQSALRLIGIVIAIIVAIWLVTAVIGLAARAIQVILLAVILLLVLRYVVNRDS